MNKSYALSPEQNEAADFRRSAVVSAGAGSGKTRVLVARYLRLVADGEKPSRIVAMTFSRKAAAELRHRIDEALSHSFHTGKLEDEPIGEEVRGKLFEARTRLGEGHIGTIHSFCQTLLVEEPTLMSDRPGFSVLDQTRVNQLKSQALRRAAWASDPLTSPLAKLRTSGLTRRAIEGMTLALIDKSWELDEARENHHLPGEVLEGLVAGCREESVRLYLEGLPDDILTLLDGQLADAVLVKKLREKELLEQNAHEVLLRLRDLLGRLVAGEVNFDAMSGGDLDMLRGAKSPSGIDKRHLHGFNTFKAVGENSKTIPNHAGCDTAKIEKEAYALAGVLFDWLDEVGDEYRRLKVGALGADYNDLLDRVAEGLRDDPKLVEGLRRRYIHFLVDEFQDTDPRQWEIIRALAVPAGDEVEKGSRTLFIVGDRKQAIYGFRGGDNTVFRRAERELAPLIKETKTLDDNYRSRQAILDFTNPVFDKIFSTDADLIAADPEGSTAVEPQKMNRLRRDGEGGSVTVINPAESVGKSVDKLQEALLTAGVIGEILRGGFPGIPAQGNYPNDKVREHTLALVGVLAPKREQLTLIAAALDCLGLGGGYALARGSGVFGTEEADWLRAALGALTDHRDGIQVAAMLLSPFGGFSYDDLLRLKRLGDESGKRWFDLVGDPAVDVLGERFASFRPRWCRWHRQAGLVGGSRLTAALYRDSGLEAALKSEGRPDRWRRLEHLLELIRAEERAGNLTGPADTLVWLRDNEESREFEEPTPEYAPVVLLTMHAAKGLEFPVVFLPFLSSKVQGPSSDYALAPDSTGHRRLTVQVRTDDAPFTPKLTPLGESILRRGGLDEELERKRLFYVSCTRAMDHLILLNTADKKVESLTGGRAGKLIGQWLNNLFTENGGEVLLDGKPVAGLVERELPKKKDADAFQPGSTVVNTELLAPLVVPDPPPVSPSALAEVARCPLRFYLRRVLKLEGEKPKTGPSSTNWDADRPWGSAFGTALHHLIETGGGVPLGEDDIRLHLAGLWNRLVSEEEEDVAESVSAFLKEPDQATIAGLAAHLKMLDGLAQWRRIREAGPHYEVPFQLELGGCLVLGRMDCLVEEGGGLGIYDFKSTGLTGADPAPIIEKHGYDVQLGVYALAAEKLFGKPVRETALLFTAEGGGFHRLDVMEVSRRAGELLKEAAELVRLPFAEVWRKRTPGCHDCNLRKLCEKNEGEAH
jgi:ATP-dependent helicase/nuclease subunit A